MTTKVPRRAQPHVVYRNAAGEKIPGVTTALGVINKYALVLWANSLGLQGIKVNEYVDELAQIGTLGHHLILQHFGGQPPDMSEFTPGQVSRAENVVRSYLEWEQERKIEAVFAEKQLVSEAYQYGGTIDWYGRIGTRNVLMDIKTGKAIYDDHLYQVGAYWELLIENGYPVDQIRVLQIGRDDSEGFSEKVVTQPEPYFQVFRCALDLYKAIKDAKGSRE